MNQAAGTNTHRHHKLALWLALITFLVMLIWFSPTDNWSWDPSFYYAHIRSPIIGGDVDFRNETSTGNIETQYTETGLQKSGWPVGSSLLWSPFFLLAHGITKLISPALADGYSPLYISMVSLASIVYGLIALYIVYKLCLRFTDQFYAAIATLACLVATPLFFYMFRQPIMAHTTGLLAAALMIYVFIILDADETLRHDAGFLFGVSMALCILTRYYGVLFAFAPLIYFVRHLRRAIEEKSSRLFWQLVLQGVIMMTVFFVTISPQMALWYRLHGRLLVMTQGSDRFVESLLPLNIFNVFIGTNRGLLYWSPFIIFGLVGIAFIPQKRLRLLALLNVASLLLLVGYRLKWWAGGGFGPRYFIEVLPFIAVGCASLLNRIAKPRRLHWLLALMLVILTLHQGVLMFSVEQGANGWLPLLGYQNGASLEVRWQWDNLLRLLQNPALYFTPRPDTSVGRQAIPVNVLAGEKDIAVYAIPILATVLLPICVYFLTCIIPKIKRKHIQIGLSLIMVWFVMWAVIYLLV